MEPINNQLNKLLAYNAIKLPIECTCGNKKLRLNKHNRYQASP